MLVGIGWRTFQFYRSTIIVADGAAGGILSAEFQFYRSTIIVLRSHADACGWELISILQKYDYSNNTSDFGLPLYHFNSTEVRL